MLVPTPDNRWVAISPYGTVWGVCDFLSSVSLQQKFEAMDRPVLRLRVISSYEPALQLCITAQFYLESKGKYILKAWGLANPKDMKRRESSPPPNFDSSFYMFFSPPPGPALCKLG